MRLPNVRRPAPSVPTVFISYRRDDSSGYAGRLHDALRERWGEGNVRMDVDDIPPGADYTQAAREMVTSSDIVLVLIGKLWLAGSNAERLADPGDLLRQEIETALESGVRVIPVLLNGAPMPDPERLPPSLAPLLKRNAFELSERRWTYDVQDLVTTVEHLPGRAAAAAKRDAAPEGRPADPEPAPARPTTRARKRPRPRTIAILALPLVGVAAAALLLPGMTDNPREVMDDALQDTAVAIAQPLPPPADEDCSRYNPRALHTEEEEGGLGWVLTDGSVKMAYLDSQADAQRALALARRHTEHCSIGGEAESMYLGGLRGPDDANYVVDYWIGDSGIDTMIPDEDCVEYSQATLRVVNQGRSWPTWLLEDGKDGRALALFKTPEDAHRGLLVAREAGQLCFIGRNNDRTHAQSYIVEYWPQGSRSAGSETGLAGGNGR